MCFLLLDKETLPGPKQRHFYRFNMNKSMHQTNCTNSWCSKLAVLLGPLQVQVFISPSADSWTALWRHPAGGGPSPPHSRLSAAPRSAMSRLYLRYHTARCGWTTTAPCYSSERIREMWRSDRSGFLNNRKLIFTFHKQINLKSHVIQNWFNKLSCNPRSNDNKSL